jgi:hypothetical protein
MSRDQNTIDEFGENRLLSRLNRRFSDLLPSLLRLPAEWRDEPAGHFKRHLAKVNLLALSVLTVGSIAAAVLLMILAIKTDSSFLFFVGVGILPGVFLVQYVLSLFCSANLNLAFSSRIQLVSRLVPDVITVLSFLLLVVGGISGVFTAISAFDSSLQQGLTLSIVSASTIVLAGLNAWIAANSEKLLDLSICAEEKQGPADYLFSLILYFGRYQLVLASYQFLATVLITAFIVVYLGIAELAGKNSMTGEVEMILGMLGAGLGIWQLIWILLTPMVAHFAYLVFVSIADIGVAFFRLVKGTEQIAKLSEEAMLDSPGEPGDRPDLR